MVKINYSVADCLIQEAFTVTDQRLAELDETTDTNKPLNLKLQPAALSLSLTGSRWKQLQDSLKTWYFTHMGMVL